MAVEALRKITAGNGRAEFLCGDFVNDARVYSKTYDYAYSRFTLHAITRSQQDELLRNIKQALRPGGKFFIEARTLRDDLFGRGRSLGDNAFIYNGHYRRFVEPEELSRIMSGMGYEVLSLSEGRGFSVTAESDPILMRLLARV